MPKPLVYLISILCALAGVFIGALISHNHIDVFQVVFICVFSWVVTYLWIKRRES